MVLRLSALFALDAAGGGLVTTAFLSYFFATRYGVSVAALSGLFFTVSVVQAVSVSLAPLLARRLCGVRLELRRRGGAVVGPYDAVADGCSDPTGAGDDGRNAE